MTTNVAQKTKVLVVDDSAFARIAISRELESDPDIAVIGVARDGLEALDKIKDLQPDVITLDVEMPRMDGLETLQNIMKTKPTPVVMLSSLTGEGTDTTIQALECGAVDFFLKSSPSALTGFGSSATDLRGKVKTAARVKRLGIQSRAVLRKIDREAPPERIKRSATMRKVIVVGSSTGGPQALYEVIPGIPADIAAGILIVQHMPPGFTRSLADRLDKKSEIEVKEAEQGDILRAGLALVAPGDYHMTINRQGEISLNQGPSVQGVRPSVDVTMDSVATAYGAATAGVVLTGMGSDGTNGSKRIKAAGGPIAVQDEDTCAIYGMPQAVVNAGVADLVMPITEIAEQIVNFSKKR